MRRVFKATMANGQTLVRTSESNMYTHVVALHSDGFVVQWVAYGWSQNEKNARRMLTEARRYLSQVLTPEWTAHLFTVNARSVQVFPNYSVTPFSETSRLITTDLGDIYLISGTDPVAVYLPSKRLVLTMQGGYSTITHQHLKNFYAMVRAEHDDGIPQEHLRQRLVGVTGQYELPYVRELT